MANPVARVQKPTVAELRKCTRRILALKLKIAQTFWDLGKELARVRDNATYAAKYRTFDEYLAADVKVARSTAYKYIGVSRAFERTFALRVVADKLDAALSYIEATPAHETPEDVPTLKIPVTKNGRTTKKALVDATQREVLEATKAVRRASGSERRHPGAEKADAFVTRVHKALEKANLDSIEVIVDWSKSRRPTWPRSAEFTSIAPGTL